MKADEIKLSYIVTGEQPAEILTKALVPKKLAGLMKKIVDKPDNRAFWKTESG